MNNTNQRLAKRAGMLPTAIVQLTEYRQCQSCGETYEVPNPSLLVRFRSRRGKGSTIANLATVRLDIDCMNLPRIRQVVQTTVEACSSCFQVMDGQMALFPEFTPRILLMGVSPNDVEEETEAASTPARMNGKVVIATPLDAF